MAAATYRDLCRGRRSYEHTRDFERSGSKRVTRRRNSEDSRHRREQVRFVPFTSLPTFNTESRLLGRILRLLSTVHIFREVTPNIFANNRLSSVMASGKTLDEIHKECVCIFSFQCKLMMCLAQRYGQQAQ